MLLVNGITVMAQTGMSQVIDGILSTLGTALLVAAALAVVIGMLANLHDSPDFPDHAGCHWMVLGLLIAIFGGALILA